MYEYIKKYLNFEKYKYIKYIFTWDTHDLSIISFGNILFFYSAKQWICCWVQLEVLNMNWRIENPLSEGDRIRREGLKTPMFNLQAWPVIKYSIFPLL